MVESRPVETFDEAAFVALTDPVFGNDARERYLKGLVGATASERRRAPRQALPRPEHRVPERTARDASRTGTLVPPPAP